MPPSADLWLQAQYLSHTFHYRMPDTVAISSVNPVVPSPLTVQMAMLASFLREGESTKAQQLLDLFPLNIKIRPPEGAIIYRGIMRYVRPPKNAEDVDKNTGAGYKISPHFREFALLDGCLEVFVETSSENKTLIFEALEQIPYLGTKDSLVTCVQVQEVEAPPQDCLQTLTEFQPDAHQGDLVMVQLANFDSKSIKDKKKPLTLENLIPSQRLKQHYSLEPYVMHGRMEASGNVKLFKGTGRRM